MKLVKGMLLSALISMPLLSQAEEVTNVTWTSSVSAGATYKDGNTDKKLFNVQYAIDRISPESDWLGRLYTEYGKTDGDQTEGQFRVQSDYRHKFGDDKNWFGGVFSEGYYDDIKNIRTRIKVGPNVGYYFYNDDVRKLDASFGVNYVYRRTADSEDDFAEFRAASKYKWNFSETAEYYFHIEYASKADDIDDGTGLLVTGVKSQMNDKLSLFVELWDAYDNMPDPDVDHNDVTLIAGITYDIM